MTDSLHIIGSHEMGGAEKFFSRLLIALEERNHEVTAIVRPNSPLIGHLSDIHYMKVGMRNIWDVLSTIRIRQIILKIKPPVVQTYMGRATRLTRIPKKLPSIHVARLGGYYKVKGYYEHADAWVGNTRGLCDYLVSSGLPADRVYHIGNFVEQRPLPPPEQISETRRSLGIPEQAIVLFSLGRFNYKKGFEDLIQAFKMVSAHVKTGELYLVVAGDGPLKRQLHSLADELGLNDSIVWIGWQNDPGLFYALADIFVCPSRIETMGNVILEAWAYGLPVLATRTPGALELIEDGTNGLLCPLNDPKGLAGKLQELLRAGKTVWRELGARGLESLQKDFSRDAIVDKYLAMYEDLLTRKGRRQR